MILERSEGDIRKAARTGSLSLFVAHIIHENQENKEDGSSWLSEKLPFTDLTLSDACHSF